MASLPPYRSLNPDAPGDLAQRLGGMSMDHDSPTPPHLGTSLSPIPSSIETAMRIPLPPPSSSLASQTSSSAPMQTASPLNLNNGYNMNANTTAANDTYGFYNHMLGLPNQPAAMPTMPMAPGMEPPFSPVLSHNAGFGFAAMQGMAMQDVPMVPDQQAQFEYGLQGYDFGHGQGGMQQKQQQQNGYQHYTPDQSLQHARQGQGQNFGPPLEAVSPTSGNNRQAMFTGAAGRGGKGGGGTGMGRWSKQAGSPEQVIGFNNRFQQPLKSPGRSGAYRPPHHRKSDASWTPAGNMRAGQDGFAKGFQGPWGTPPSLVSDRSVGGTPNTSYPATPRSRSGSTFSGIGNNTYRSPTVAMPMTGYSPQNPYAQQEYYQQIQHMSPAALAYAGYGPAAKPRPWRRFDDQPKSRILEEFRSGRSTRAWNLKDIAGNIIEFSGDQSGSRLIQERIEQATDADRQAIFDEVRPNAMTLMNDVYGNYVIQKFFEFGSAEQKRFLVDQMMGRVLSLSNQMYGCRVVQTALDHVEDEARAKIIAELNGHYLECVKQANANHVIQRIVLNNPPQHVLDSFIGHVRELALHTFGCRVLQKALETLSEQQLRPILNELHESVPMLIEDAFGNYVAQSMITAGPIQDRDKVVEVVKRKVFIYSRHKFASNVVEKAIRHSNTEHRRELVYGLVFYKSEGFHRVPMLLKDSYANFVFQTCLQHADRQQRQQLLDLLVPLLPTLMHTPVGKRISVIMDTMAAEGFHMTPVSTANGPDIAVDIDGRVSPAGSDVTETATEIGTVIGNNNGRGGRYGSRPGSATGSNTTISSPTPRHAEHGHNATLNVGLGINMNGASGRELRPTASAPPMPRTDKDDWRTRTRNTPSPAGQNARAVPIQGSPRGPSPVPAQKPMMVPSSVASARSLKATVSMLDG